VFWLINARLGDTRSESFRENPLRIFRKRDSKARRLESHVPRIAAQLYEW
jgi:hypothetical protein